MSKVYPSMTALLGLLAVAGYQNRDGIAEFLKGRDDQGSEHSSAASVPDRISETSGSGTLGNLLGGLGTASVGGMITSGLSELVDHATARYSSSHSDSHTTTDDGLLLYRSDESLTARSVEGDWLVAHRDNHAETSNAKTPRTRRCGVFEAGSA